MHFFSTSLHSVLQHPHQPQVLNPHKPESLELVKKMVEQQLLLQPDVKHLHIGADEVWDLGSSPESQDQINNYGQTKETLFLNYVREVAGIITRLLCQLSYAVYFDSVCTSILREDLFALVFADQLSRI